MDNSWYIGKSRVHGCGVIASRDIMPNELVGEALNFVTPSKIIINKDFGAWLNHKSSPIDNVKLKKFGSKWMAISLKHIPEGAEIVIDYDKLPEFLKGSKKYFK